MEKLSCNKCPEGYSILSVKNETNNKTTQSCLACNENCLKCNISNVKNITTNICLSCESAYFLFEGNCEKMPNAGMVVEKKS